MDLQVVVYWEFYADGWGRSGLYYRRAEAENHAREVERQWDAAHPGATASKCAVDRPCLFVRPVLCASAGHGMLFVLSREVHEEQ